MVWTSLRRLHLVGLTLPVAGLAVGLAPLRDASACSPDPCAGSRRLGALELRTSEIPTDGVLVFSGHRADGTDFTPADLDDITVELTQDGVPVDGQLEIVAGFGLVWRPSATLPSSSALALNLTIDNTARIEAEIGLECAEDLISLEAAVLTAGSAPPPTMPTLEAVENVLSRPANDLHTMVCCDGGFPFVEPYCGVEEILWGEGICTGTRAIGELSAGFQVGDSLEGIGSANVLYRALIDDGRVTAYQHRPTGFGIHAETPVCVRVEALSLITGDVASSDQEVCVGQDVADQLGPQSVDPAEFLAECQSEPYVCEVVEEGAFGQWDPNDCVPYDGEPDPEPNPGEGTGGETGDDSSSEVDPDPPSSGSGGRADTDGDDGASADGDGGCSVSPGTSPGAWLFVVLGFGLGWRQRRRRS